MSRETISKAPPEAQIDTTLRHFSSLRRRAVPGKITDFTETTFDPSSAKLLSGISFPDFWNNYIRGDLGLVFVNIYCESRVGTHPETANYYRRMQKRAIGHINLWVTRPDANDTKLQMKICNLYKKLCQSFDWGKNADVLFDLTEMVDRIGDNLMIMGGENPLYYGDRLHAKNLPELK